VKGDGLQNSLRGYFTSGLLPKADAMPSIAQRRFPIRRRKGEVKLRYSDAIMQLMPTRLAGLGLVSSFDLRERQYGVLLHLRLAYGQ